MEKTLVDSTRSTVRQSVEPAVAPFRFWWGMAGCAGPHGPGPAVRRDERWQPLPGRQGRFLVFLAARGTDGLDAIVGLVAVRAAPARYLVPDRQGPRGQAALYFRSAPFQRAGTRPERAVHRRAYFPDAAVLRRTGAGRPRSDIDDVGHPDAAADPADGKSASGDCSSASRSRLFTALAIRSGATTATIFRGRLPTRSGITRSS